jgi:hypothetical protein
VASTAQAGDEEATAQVMEYARAVLVAVASLEEETEVDLESLTVGTATAACILSFHQEYVRDLARRNALKATKENGEYRIRFPDLIESLLCARRPLEGMTAVPTWLPGFRPASLHELGETSHALWRRKRRSQGKDQEA